MLNEVEKQIYAAAFAVALERAQEQARSMGFSGMSYPVRHAVTRACIAVEEFRSAFESLVLENGEEDPVTQMYFEAIGHEIEDGEEGA